MAFDESAISTTIERLHTKIKSRGIRLLPTLTPADISKFEQSNAIALPTDYREFLLHIGNGGIGPPTYNLCALGAKPSDFDFAADLSKPFPFTQPWIWE